MMTEKKKKIKIGKLNKGRVTRNPELVIMYNLLERMNSYEELRGLIQRAFEKDGKRKSEKFLKTMLGLILSGGKHIREVDILKGDEGLKRVVGEDCFYSPNRMTEIILKMSKDWDFINDLMKILLDFSSRLLAKLIKKKKLKEITLDIDASYIVNKGKDAKRNYRNEPSMRVMVVSVAETEQTIYGYLDEGNKAPHSKLTETIESVLGKLNDQGVFKKVRKVIIRSDSAGWIREFIGKISEEYNLTFIVKSRRDESIKEIYREEIKSSSDWDKFFIRDKNGIMREYEYKIVPRVMGSNPNEMVSFNLYLYRERIDNRPVIKEFEYMANWRYFGIGTNLECGGEQLLRAYHERAESENIIKELKWDMGLRSFYSGNLNRNNIVFLFAIIVQNFFKYFKLMYLPEEWRELMIASIRYRLKEAALVVITGGYIIFRFNPGYPYLRIWEKLILLIR